MRITHVCMSRVRCYRWFYRWMDGWMVSSLIHLYKCSLSLSYVQDIVHEGTPINKTSMVPALCPCLAHGLVGETDTI